MQLQRIIYSREANYSCPSYTLPKTRTRCNCTKVNSLNLITIGRKILVALYIEAVIVSLRLKAAL